MNTPNYTSNRSSDGRFARKTPLLKLIGAALFFLVVCAIAGAVVGYSEAVAAPTPDIKPVESLEDVKVFNPDMEAILKNTVSEIWDGEKFVPSGDFELVKKAEAKTEEPKVVSKGSVEDKIRAKFGEYANIAVAVAKCESGLRENAVGDKHIYPHSYGVFQVRAFPTRPSIDKLLTADANIEFAYQLSKGGTSWSHWSAYKNGCYRKFM